MLAFPNRQDVRALLISSQFEESGGLVEAEIRLEFRDWNVVWVQPRLADHSYLFFASDPGKSEPVGSWGGVAAPFEEREMNIWVTQNIPGVPSELAACFAWFVSKSGGG